MEKSQTRREIKSRLLKIEDQERSEKSRQLCRNLTATPQFKRASTVMIYLSMPYEVDTTPIILQCWQQGKTVVVPKVSWQQRHMIPIEISSLETGIATGAGGLRNPTTGAPMPIDDIDIVVAPGLAFDKNGNRLGRGGGYYDRFLASDLLKAPVCSLAFKEQIIDEVPTDEHDKPIDFIVTEDQIINCD